jgi:predicted O-methyltransferase YrrM
MAALEHIIQAARILKEQAGSPKQTLLAACLEFWRSLFDTDEWPVASHGDVSRFVTTITRRTTMRFWAVSLAGLSIILLVTDGGLAQSPRRGQASRQGPSGQFDPMRMHTVMQALDTNGDGELSAEEIAGASQSLKKLDKNDDGKLSREELRPTGPGRGGPDGPGRPGGPEGFGGPRGPGMGPRGEGQQASLDAAPTAKDDAEAKILKLLQEIPQSQGWMANVPATDGRLLRLLAETIDAKSIVEIGTSNGHSDIWLALALRKTGGKLVTHEIDPDTAALARKNFAAAGVSDLITIVEGDAHQTVSQHKGPIDLVFIDADKQGYLDYFNKLLPLVRPGGLILAHNMNARMADPAFLKAITTNPDVETVFYSSGGGMSVTLKKR